MSLAAPSMPETPAQTRSSADAVAQPQRFTDAPKPITLAIMAMGGEGGGVLADWLIALAEANDLLSNCEGVFPLLSAIRTGKSTAPGAEEKRSLRDWGSRALLETSILFVLFDDTGS